MRGARGHGGGRFLPLADIFISATACILLLFVISSRVQRTEPYRVPQADALFACKALQADPAGGAPQPGALFARIDPGPPADLSAEAFEAELRRLSPSGRLSVRVQLHAAVADDTCPPLAAEIVERLNAAYDAPSAAPAPAAYLLLEVVRAAGPEGPPK